MNIYQLEDMLAIMKKLNLSEVRCLDELSGASCELSIKNELIDKEGNLVTELRQKNLNYSPYNKQEQEKIYQENLSLSKQYDYFEDYYDFIEDNRKKEIKLIKEAKEVMLISPMLSFA